MKQICKIILGFGVTAALLLGAINPVMAACWQWSLTASANGTADPTINWAEGMAPSSVNDSGRAMMARIAECRDDWSGKLTTAGTLVAYTVTTNQGLAATPQDGQLLAITMHATNGINPTLRADSGNTYPITVDGTTAIPVASLVLGTPYTVKFNLSAGSWVVRDYYGNPYTVPLGGIMAYTGNTAPNSNFVLPYGQCISRTVYAAYFSQVSTTFGACDGTTTFGVPDLRGRVIAGIGNMGGVDAGRLTATYFGASGTGLGNTGGSESHTLTTAEMPTHTHTANVTDPGHFHNTAAFTSFPAGATPNAVPTSGQPLTNPTSSNTTGITVTNADAGSSNPHATVQPTMVLYYILRVM